MRSKRTATVKAKEPLGQDTKIYKGDRMGMNGDIPTIFMVYLLYTGDV